ncbi:polyphosphate polymerase domain-containing protein [Enterococcus pallens]|uniref:VTC domain-containing protein n=1 Tax=Enterococcus pallens ATCC BAA-351 TaxID=1158607 RepID=R2Q319_9ENTE|nr:polyphosphate polymerase domain-containing protein [Enterococcus pallens]EOH90947.1 hypothetical protein UAU_03486 [Enterococcus pallens ATCC BAA-351]EOU16143.1 hypothetical protein I588_03799 [Enterococcus pallens ATCC BAA-351]OJG77382.1 hypothetical protein RV10_GL002492 [Enterococcus pallens]
MAKVKVKSGEIFERREKKYLMTPEKFDLLLTRLQEYMTIDEYGLHTIHTIYYDTEDLAVIRHSVDKPKFKEKMRLRSYGLATNQSTVYLELKKKVAGVTYKRRTAMTYQEAKNFLNYGVKPQEQKQIFKELDWYTQQQKLQSTVLISYDRIALKHKKDENFRITFDQNIRYSLEHFELDQVDQHPQIRLTTEPTVLMEVKIFEAFPLEISRLFSELQIFQGKFTKYGNVYHWVLFPEWEKQHTRQSNQTIKTIERGESLYA